MQVKHIKPKKKRPSNDDIPEEEMELARLLATVDEVHAKFGADPEVYQDTLVKLLS